MIQRLEKKVSDMSDLGYFSLVPYFQSGADRVGLEVKAMTV